MNIDEINQLVRMAQVLRVRAGTLGVELIVAKRPELAKKAESVGQLMRGVETKLISIGERVLK